ncbi:Exosome complex component MTR3 [Chamberlinius hualienensis]
MPPISKRIVGPSVSYSPTRFAVETEKVGNKPKIGEGRCDGRQPHDIRPFFLKVGVVSQAKGSSYIEMGKTKVLCSVYGPREITKKKEGFSIKGKIHCEFKYAPFSCVIRRQFQQDQEEKELSQVMNQALEPVICSHTFPKARVDVFIQVLQNDGGALAVAITAAGAALADAGIPMFDLIMGCNLVNFKYYNQLLVSQNIFHL